jgi:hypothetical protein
MGNGMKMIQVLASYGEILSQTMDLDSLFLYLKDKNVFNPFASTPEVLFQEMKRTF